MITQEGNQELETVRDVVETLTYRSNPLKPAEATGAAAAAAAAAASAAAATTPAAVAQRSRIVGASTHRRHRLLLPCPLPPASSHASIGAGRGRKRLAADSLGPTMPTRDDVLRATAMARDGMAAHPPPYRASRLTRPSIRRLVGG